MLDTNCNCQPRTVSIRRIVVAQLLAGLMLGGLILPGSCGATLGPADPAAETRLMVARAVQILHDQALPLGQRRFELLRLARSRFGLARMARASLGSHWNELTLAERQHFVPLFEAFIEDAYLDHIQHYADLDIGVTGESFIDRSHARVDASVIRPGQDPIPITFLLERAGRNWAVYDVAVGNVSMVENYRAQFNRVIRTHGIGQLMADLRAKQAKLAALLGHPQSSVELSP